jgi:hypothetical protein
MQFELIYDVAERLTYSIGPQGPARSFIDLAPQGAGPKSMEPEAQATKWIPGSMLPHRTGMTVSLCGAYHIVWRARSGHSRS